MEKIKVFSSKMKGDLAIAVFFHSIWERPAHGNIDFQTN